MDLHQCISKFGKLAFDLLTNLGKLAQVFLIMEIAGPEAFLILPLFVFLTKEGALPSHPQIL